MEDDSPELKTKTRWIESATIFLLILAIYFAVVIVTLMVVKELIEVAIKFM